MLLLKLEELGFLERSSIKNDEIFHLTTPITCRFKENIVNDLKREYRVDEEIGGVFWARPEVVNTEKFYIVEKVSYIRNAIEDTPYHDKLGRLRTRKDAYRPDPTEINTVFNKIYESGCLPIKFHTHPVKGKNAFEELVNSCRSTETSEQDIIESEIAHQVEDKKLLMPRCLIVSNDFGQNIFIGLYGGFISPSFFEESKRKVVDENINSVVEEFSGIKLTNEKKLLLALGAVILLAIIIKYRKYSIPVIIGLAIALPNLLTNTSSHDKPNYFNKLSSGDADIHIPKWEE